jgi:hypothetical protein
MAKYLEGLVREKEKKREIVKESEREREREMVRRI